MSEQVGLGPHTPVVVAARRTPVGTAGRSLAGVDVVDLTAAALAALAEDLTATGVLPQTPIDDVVIGNTRGPGGNIARVAALRAGLGVGVPGVTLDRQCGSGQAAVHQAASHILSGTADLVLAGGAESASTQPLTAWPDGKAFTRPPFAPVDFADPEMGIAADDLAAAHGIDRDRQDAYAHRSHRLSLASIGSGLEDGEIVPVAGLRQDERPRPISMSVLQRLPAAFHPGGTVTAGNSCGISDGAAVVAVVSERLRARLGVPGLALRAWTAAGVDPRWPGLGPVPAVQTLLGRSGIGWEAIDVVEITEAFASVVLACSQAWGLDPMGRDGERVCPQGGAIARGHPWGASGALLVVRLFSQIVRSVEHGCDGPSVGVATCAIGGGQGLALLAERVGR